MLNPAGRRQTLLTVAVTKVVKACCLRANSTAKVSIVLEIPLQTELRAEDSE